MKEAYINENRTILLEPINQFSTASFVVSLGTVPAQNGTIATYIFSIGNRTGIDKITSK